MAAMIKTQLTMADSHVDTSGLITLPLDVTGRSHGGEVTLPDLSNGLLGLASLPTG